MIVDFVLAQITVEGEEGIRLIPELYAVPADKVNAEMENPGSQERVIIGRCPFMWAQSLYILGKLLQDVRTPSIQYSTSNRGMKINLELV